MYVLDDSRNFSKWSHFVHDKRVLKLRSLHMVLWSGPPTYKHEGNDTLFHSKGDYVVFRDVHI